MEVNQKSTKPSDAVTTSTESESFDSWTLVSDAEPKAKQSSADIIIASEANENNESSGIEEITNEEEFKSHENDDLSDGISIISDCESAGRLSPSHQNEINDENQSNNQSHEPLTPPNTPDSLRDQSSQTRKTKTSHCFASVKIQSKDAFEKIVIRTTPAPSESISSSLTFFPSSSVSKVFIISVLIAFIAFFGNLKSYWNDSTTKLPQLFHRIEDLELQNNLLRAEIDILSKNLNSINQNREKFMKKDEKVEKQKNLKNGDRATDGFQAKKDAISNNERIIKESVNNEPAGFSNPPSQSSSALPTYCKEGENLWCSQGSKNEDATNQLEEQVREPDAATADEKSQYHHDHSDYEEKQRQGDKEFKKHQEKDYKKKFDSREQNGRKENFENKKFEKKQDEDHKKYDSQEYQRNFNQKHENKYEERHEKKDDRRRDNSKERFDKKQRQHEKKKFDDSDHDDDDSGEYHHHDFKTDKRRDSRERIDSKEHYEKRKNFQKNGKQKNVKDDSDDDDDDHDDWHEKMMQHRENIRKTKKKNDSNWYLERGSSREEARILE